jgi:ATP-dependent Clp protease ATP-binding subunit ClpX
MRAILEQQMLDIMYEVPFLPGVKECKITKEVIEKNEPPLLTYEEEQRTA